MSISFIMTAILAVALVTNLTVEGIKKLLDETEIKYSSNLLAAIMSVIIAAVLSAMYLVMSDMSVTPKIIVQIVVIMYLSFLASTVGYDKVIQMLEQLKISKLQEKKEEFHKEIKHCLCLYQLCI